MDSRDEVVLEGWLYKVDKKKLISQLKKRYFMLNGTALMYFKADPHKNNEANSRGQIIQLTPESRVVDSGRDKSFGREIYIFTLNVSGDKKWLMGSKNPELVARWIEGIFSALRRLWIVQEQKGLSEPAAEKRPTDKSPESSKHRNGHTERLSIDQHVICMLKQSNRSVYRKFGHEGVYIDMSPTDRMAQSREVTEGRENSMDEMDDMGESRTHFDTEVDWQLLSVSNGLRIFEEKKAGREGTRCVKATSRVRAPCYTILRFLLDYGKSRNEWDPTFVEGNVLSTVDGHTDIVYERTASPCPRLRWLFPEMSLYMNRYWGREEDGTYVILLRSESKNCPPNQRELRSNLISGAWIISPLENESLVMNILELELGSWWGVPMSRIGFHAWYTWPLLNRVAGIRELFEQSSDYFPEYLWTSLEMPATAIPDDIRQADGAKGSRKDSSELESSSPENQSDEDDELEFAGNGEPPEQFNAGPDDTVVKSPLPKDLRAASEQLLDSGTIPVSEYCKKARSIFQGSCRPLDESNDSKNCWTTFSGNLFAVRSKGYLQDRIKQQAGKPLFQTLGFDWITSHERIDNICSIETGTYQKFRRELKKQGMKEPFIFAINLQVPAGKFFQAILYFLVEEMPEPGTLLHRFLNEDQSFRNSRFKLIPSITQGAWVVKRSVGKKPLIVGRALKTRYFKTDQYFEIDVDISSSAVANGITRFVIGYMKNLVIDLGFTVEGQAAEELPEQLIGVIRVMNLDPAKAKLTSLSS